MYTAKQLQLLDDQGVQYTLFEEGQILTYSDVIHKWQTDLHFIGFFNNLLAKSKFPAFFWEVKPITHQELDSPFEFVLVNSKGLAQIEANPEAFHAYFASIKMAVSFPNLGNDAVLVAPTPQRELEHYAHLAVFTRKAALEQQVAFWKLLGKEYERAIDAQPKWLSTSGLGVYWLHARISTKPKYYSYQAYRHYSTS